MITMRQNPRFENIFWIDNRIATENMVPGQEVYGERLIKIKGKEYRLWDPTRSKPAAAMSKNLQQFPLKEGMKVLYIGFASGTSGSHFSDIIGKKGLIYGIEISERVLRESLPLSRKRENIVPLLADARMPEDYSWIEQVDLIYADIAVREQSEVLIRNARMFLKPGGFAMIAIKARSIDVTERPQIVYKNERKKLEEFFNVMDFVELHPYERDHGFFVLRKK